MNRAREPVRSRWILALRRLQGLLGISAASAAQEPADEEVELAPAPVELRIQAMPSAYPLGYPVAVRVIARNSGSEALPVKGRLNPSYGLVRIEHRRRNAAQWTVLEPLAWFEPIGDEEAMLQPGEYEVRARLQAGKDVDDALSAPLGITIAQPRNDDDVAALQPLIDERGQLVDGIGRLLAFGGRIGSEPVWKSLQATAEQYGHTALGGALRLTLVTAASADRSAHG